MYAVTNQPPPLEPYNLLQTDRVLREVLVREKAGWAAESSSRWAKRSVSRKPSGLASRLTKIRRCCTRSIATVIASTKSNFIRHGIP